MPEQAVGFTPTGAEKVARATEIVLARGAYQFGPQLRPPMDAPPGGVPIYNPSSSLTIPAWGCLKPSGGATSGSLNVGQPDTSLVPFYLLNGGGSIPPLSYGTALSPGAVQLGVAAASTAAVGDMWGPTPSSWNLTNGNPGLLYVLSNDSTWVWGVYGLIEALVGQANASIAAGASGTCTAWMSNSSGGPFDAATTFQFTGWNDSSQSVAAATNLQFKLINGFWNIDFESCSS